MRAVTSAVAAVVVAAVVATLAPARLMLSSIVLRASAPFSLSK